MGCGSSKNTAVQEIDLQDEVEVNHGAAKQDALKEKQSSLEAATIHPKTTLSARSRDSGVQDLDFSATAPGFVGDFKPKTQERQESRKILEELEAQGLIQGGRVSGGAMAFDVSLDQGRAGRLEPLGEVRAPRRLERLNSGKRRPPSRQQLDEKMRNAEMRRDQEKTRKSRLAKQLAAHVARSKQVAEDDDDDENEPVASALPPSGLNHRLPPLPPPPATQSRDLPSLRGYPGDLSSPPRNNATLRPLGSTMTSDEDDVSSLEDGMSITNDVNSSFAAAVDEKDNDSDDFYLR